MFSLIDYFFMALEHKNTMEVISNSENSRNHFHQSLIIIFKNNAQQQRPSAVSSVRDQ